MRSGLIGFALLLASVLQSFSQTLVPAGNVSGKWGLVGSPYLVQGDIAVPSESTLVIDPGVSVVFQGHFALNVQGRLLAVGTETDSIRFTVNDTTGFSDADTVLGGWYGIRLINTPLWNDSTILAYCSLKHGKAIGQSYPANTGGAISIANFGKVRISNCLVAHNMAGGSSLPGGGGIALTGASAVLTGNLIADNISRGQGGGILLNGAKLWSTQNRYVGNSASDQGGGVLIEGGCQLVFQGDSIVSNVSSTNGGGMQAYGQSRITMEGVCFYGNTANWGGGLAVLSCTLSVSNCAFGGNTAVTDGGGIGASLSSLDIPGNLVSSNKCRSDGGGIYAYHCDLRLRSSSFASNRAGFDSLTGTGGAICADGGSLHIGSCSFLGDTATVGGGLRVYNCDLIADSVHLQEEYSFNVEAGLYWNVDSIGYSHPYTLSLRRIVFLRNNAKNNYAAAYILQPTISTSLADVSLDQCLFVENAAKIVPALGVSGTFADVLIANCSFLRNVASSRTAGLSFAGGAQGTVSNCLFGGNTCTAGTSVGAGLSMGGNCDVNVVNCTFAFNVANSGSALSVRSGTKARVTNAIFWGNTGAYIAVATTPGVGAHVNANYCNFQHGEDSITVSDSLSTFVWGVGNCDGDPLFVDTVGMDFHLSTGSHCIAAGVDSIEVDSVWQWAPLNDIEGLPRPRPLGTRPDMGAFEEQLTPPAGVARKSGGDVPLVFGLEQNFPNPFNPKTVIRCQWPVVSNVRLVVYDILGREVATLLNERKAPGKFEFELDASALTSGVYFCRLTAGEYVETRKMVLLK